MFGVFYEDIERIYKSCTPNIRGSYFISKEIGNAFSLLREKLDNKYRKEINLSTDYKGFQ